MSPTLSFQAMVVGRVTTELYHVIRLAPGALGRGHYAVRRNLISNGLGGPACVVGKGDVLWVEVEEREPHVVVAAELLVSARDEMAEILDDILGGSFN